MFSFFKRKKETPFVNEKLEISEKEFELLQRVVATLPSNYDFLRSQTNPEFLRGKRVNIMSPSGGFSLIFDQNMEKKMRQLKPYYRLGGIKVLNVEKNVYEPIFLDILDQILIGFSIPSQVEAYDLETVKSELIFEKKPKNSVFDKIKGILGEENLESLKKYLSLNNIFELELNGENFYTVHEFGDGNYLAINDKSEIFGLFHDPYKVEKIFNNPKQMVGDLETKIFSLEAYKNQNT